MYSNRYLLSCGAAAIVMSVAAQAQAEVRRFDIPAQPAVTAIPEFARQARLQVIAPARELTGVNTPAIQGEMEVDQALSRLIAGTPLRVVSRSSGIITLGTQAIAGRGQLAGRVLDPATGQYLANASIRVTDASGQRRTGTSGERGEFRFTGLASGSAEVELSFTGFVDQAVTVNIADGETRELEFALVRPGDSDALTVSDIIVTASSRDGDARAIMSQRNSMDIKNSLSSESFGAIDEGNVGEFIRYMPGVDAEGEGDDSVRYVRLRGLPPEYTAITVSGVSLSAADANNGAADSRAFSFEQVSLSSIDNIEISKTVSADVDANAPAGTINLRTKRAFDRKGRRISGSISGYTHSDMLNSHVNGPGEGEHDKRILPNGRIEYSDVFFDRRLGVVASLSQTNTYTELEQSYYPRSYAPTANSPEPMAMNSIFMRLNAQETSRFASSLTLDYRATDRLILSLASIYNNSYLWSGQRTYSFTAGARANGVEGDPAVDFTTLRGASVAAGSNIIAKKGEGKTFVPSFEYAGDTFTVDGNLSYSDSTSNYDPQGEGAVYNFVTSPTATGNFHAYRPGLDSTQFRIQQVSGADWADPASYPGTNSLTYHRAEHPLGPGDLQDGAEAETRHL